MAQEKYIPFRCSGKLYDRLAQVAEVQDLTISEVVRLACEDYVSQSPQKHNLIPFVGTITGGSEDAAIWEAIKAEFVQIKKEFQQKVEDLAA